MKRIFCILLLGALLLGGCAPAASKTPETLTVDGKDYKLTYYEVMGLSVPVAAKGDANPQVDYTPETENTGAAINIQFFLGDAYSAEQTTATLLLRGGGFKERTEEQYRSEIPGLIKFDVKGLSGLAHITMGETRQEDFMGHPGYVIEYSFDNGVGLTFASQLRGFFHDGLMYQMDVSVTNNSEQAPEDEKLVQAMVQGILFKTPAP